MQVTCEQCKAVVDSRGLYSHQRGGHCEARTKAEKLQKQGYEPIHSNQAQALLNRPLSKAFFKPIIEATIYYSGSKHKAGKFCHEGWILNKSLFLTLREEYHIYDEIESFLQESIKKRIEDLKNLKLLKEVANGSQKRF